MPKKVLFICGQNRLRSPTAERVFSGLPGFEFASGGLNHDADEPVSPELLRWADIIIVMEKKHRTRLSKRFRPHLKGKKVICLDIPDNYEYMDPELIGLLKKKAGPLLRAKMK